MAAAAAAEEAVECIWQLAIILATCKHIPEALRHAQASVEASCYWEGVSIKFESRLQEAVRHCLQAVKQGKCVPKKHSEGETYAIVELLNEHTPRAWIEMCMSYRAYVVERSAGSIRTELGNILGMRLKAPMSAYLIIVGVCNGEPYGDSIPEGCEDIYGFLSSLATNCTAPPVSTNDEDALNEAHYSPRQAARTSLECIVNSKGFTSASVEQCKNAIEAAQRKKEAMIAYHEGLAHQAARQLIAKQQQMWTKALVKVARDPTLRTTLKLRHNAAKMAAKHDFRRSMQAMPAIVSMTTQRKTLGSDDDDDETHDIGNNKPEVDVDMTLASDDDNETKVDVDFVDLT